MGSINIITSKEIQDEIQGISQELPNYFKNFIEGLKELFGVELSIYTPYDQGDLVSSAFFTDLGEYSWMSDNEKNYYPFVILGTGEHWIGSAVFIAKIGEWRYIGMHPGTAPQDYPLQALESGEPQVDPRLDEMGSWITME